MNVVTARDLARAIHAAGVAAALPGPAARRALRAAPAPRSPVHILALGKASRAMAEAALERLRAIGAEPAGGLVVGTGAGPALHPALAAARGDHPVPGGYSARAAEALGSAARAVGTDDECWVLLSGGTSSLIAAPVDGVAAEDLIALFQALLRSGLDIIAANRVRKQFLRWGAGRLAAALAPARMRVLIASDVIGDDPATIGSGPCEPDDTATTDVADHLAALARSGLLDGGAAVRLEACLGGTASLRAGDPAFDRVTTTVVARIDDAVAGAAAAAEAAGAETRAATGYLRGEARAAAERIIADATSGSTTARNRPQRCTIYGGETTVSLGGTQSPGGRCQELALAAARTISGMRGITLLAAGTDGRDGPTDAAGAVVDGGTWAAIRAAGREPDADLAGHRSHAALDAVGALIRTGATGTNVGDLVIVLEEGRSGQGWSGSTGR